jgi:hypothetical protein
MSIPMTAAPVVSAISRENPPVPQPTSRTRWTALIRAASTIAGTQGEVVVREARVEVVDREAVGAKGGSVYFQGGESAQSLTFCQFFAQ